MNRKWDYIMFLLIAIIAVATYWPLTKSFFQQDEWVIFGNIIYSNLTHKNILGVILPFSGFSHFAPWTRILTKFTFDFFHLNFPYYAYLAIFFQIINSFLAFFLARTLTKNKLISLIAAIFFATSSISHQATTWMATNIGTQGSTVFLFLSIIFFVKYLIEIKKNIYLLFSVVFWIISTGFKESGIIVLLFFPLLWFFYEKKKRIRSFLKTFLPLSMAVFIYLLVRLIINFTAPPPAGVEQLTQPEPIVYLFRALANPIRAVSQSFFQERILVWFSTNLVRVAYPQFMVDKNIADPYVVGGPAVDIISFFFTIAILTITSIYLRIFHNKRIKYAIIFSLLFIITSVFPLIIIPGRAGFFSIFEPRELYLAILGSSLIFAIFIYSISLYLAKVLRKEKFFPFFVLLIATSIAFLNIKIIRSDLRAVNSRGEIRKSILTQISTKYPKLPQKIVFYAESDLAYYGLAPEETILPFQSGFGQTLLIWYAVNGEKFPPCFFIPQEDFLYNIYAQDYKFCQGKGFGYFRKFDKLKIALEKNNLSFQNVIAFKFSSATNSLQDITDEIRTRLNQ